LVQYLY